MDFIDVIQDLKNDLIAGLLVVIPLATTIWLSSIVSKFVLGCANYKKIKNTN